MSQYNNLIEFQQACCQQFANQPMYGTRGPSGWSWLTYAGFAQKVDELRAGLMAAGLKPGERVGIIGPNSVKWAVAAYAVYGAGAVLVPMYEDQRAKDWQHVLHDSAAKVVFVDGAAHINTLADLRTTLPALESVIDMQAPASQMDGYASLTRLGQQQPVAPRSLTNNTLANLIYTSGTTGKPKGVMLSHGNILSNVMSVAELMDVTSTDRSLCFLPWAHAFGQLAELHGMMVKGASAALVPDVLALPKYLVEIRPTMLYGVPRVFNGLYGQIHGQLSKESRAVQLLYADGIKLAAQAKLGPLQKARLAAADKLIFSKIRQRLGGRLRFAVSGAAALNPEVGAFLAALGIPVYEGYGLSETSPIVAVNSPRGHKLGTVGKVLPGVVVRLQDTPAGTAVGAGEIVVYGPNVMQGYWQQTEQTKAVMSTDGGFHTGDLGCFDTEGFLQIRGREKEQYKLENGHYVAPAILEEQLQLSPYIQQLLVYGENRATNAALIVPDSEALQQFADEQGLVERGEALLATKAVRRLYKKELKRLGREFKRHEAIKQFVFSMESWTTNNGLLTPTLKPRRAQIVAQHRQALEALYQ